jgi:DNA-directed RNA polymerase specialized sigma24 family protein
MSLELVRDEFLAARASRGDAQAFTELARRYRPLIVSAAKYPPPGLELDELRQEGLIGLFAACRKCDPAKPGRFAGLARLCVGSAISHARRSSWAGKHVILTRAVADHDELGPRVELQAAGPGSDPAVVVELREQLRELAAREQRRRDGVRWGYSDEQRRRAVALVAEGQTFQQAALAVGTRADTVARWVKRAGTPRPGTLRRYTPAEIAHVLSLVQTGASLRRAGAAVGASDVTVLRWVRNAA